MDRWVGKTAVVTGASAGIGAAVSVALANRGLHVVGLARRIQLVQELKSSVTGTGSITGVKCDVGKPEEIEEAFKWIEKNLGCVHVIINNAGLMKPGNISEIDSKSSVKDEDLISEINVNVTGLVLCARRAVRSMHRHNFPGHVINISSIAGQYVPQSLGFNVYPSTKHAVTVFSETLATELAQLRSKIRVTNLSPGLVDTPMASEAVKIVDFEALKPQDIADAIVYVLSTPPNVNIMELKIQAVGEKKL